MINVASQRLESSIIFDSDWYHSKNPDTIKTKAAVHAVEHGYKEGRQIFNPAKIASFIASAEFAPFRTNLPSHPININVYASSRGNVFMNEIAGDIVYWLRQAGSQATLRSEINSDAHDEGLKLVVAPHEFFYLNHGPQFFNARFMENCIVYNTEQIQTPWFARSLPALLCSRMIVDINNQNASILTQFGIPTLHWEPPVKVHEPPSQHLLNHPLMQAICHHAPNKQWRDRPIDVSFLGSHSQKRDKTLARIGAGIHDLESFIYCGRRNIPLLEGKDYFLPEIGSHVASLSKIYLNIHRDAMPFFEWHRIVRQGMAAGALVVTDPCLPHPLYKHGHHFFEVNTRHMIDAIYWLTNEPSGQHFSENIVATNLEILQDKKQSIDSTNILISFISENIGV